MLRGRLIAFEGPEGSGKSTQIERLAAYLRVSGREVVVTREPGGTALGEAIRELLLARNGHEMTARTEALLLNAARAEHVHRVIEPALQRGAIVLTDRFSDSTLAYQGGGRGLPMDDLLGLQLFTLGELRPDLRILFELPPEIGLQRRFRDDGTWNRLDEEDIAFHQRVVEAYREIAAAAPETWIVIDAAATEGEVFESLAKAVKVHVQ